MKTKYRYIIAAAAVCICMIACIAALTFTKTANTAKKENITKNENITNTSDPLSLNVSLYRVLPEYESFEETVRECWKEKHPDVELNFVDWDCYSDTVPDDLDVFVIDTTNLDSFAEKGFLLPLKESDLEDYDDLIPSFVEGCRVDGTIYSVPQILCTELLYTRKGDAELQDIKTLYGLQDALGNSGLVTDKKSDEIRVCMYLQAIIDDSQKYTDYYPPIEEGQISDGAAASLEIMRDMRQKDPDRESESSGWYFYAEQFAQGTGRAYIGYSEAMDVMDGKESEMEFRLFSMTDAPDIPVFYADAAAVNANISKEKKELALELLNLITGTDMMVKASDNDGNPRYLLAARYSIYDKLESKYPIYAELKKIASVSDAHVFRIKPDGAAYMEEAVSNADLLPPL